MSILLKWECTSKTYVINTTWYNTGITVVGSHSLSFTILGLTKLDPAHVHHELVQQIQVVFFPWNS